MSKNRATCHPDRYVKAKGLCPQCYRKQWRDSRPEIRQRERSASLANFYNNRTARMNTKMKSMYGISSGVFHQMLQKQNWECKICCKDLCSRRNTHVDHCHTTGAIRGILCGSCNKGIGQFGDSADLLIKAAKYLEVSNSRADFYAPMRKVKEKSKLSVSFEI